MAHETREVTAGAGTTSGTGPAATGTAPPPYPPGTSAEQIRRDIERTRAEMDKTVDVLQERLRPRHLLDDALEALRGWSASSRSPDAATANNAVDAVGQVGGRVVESLRENPVPAALIGAGVAWLVFGSGKSPSWPRRRGMTMADYTPRKWDVPDYSGSYVDARTGQPYTAEYGDDARARQGGISGGGYQAGSAGTYAGPAPATSGGASSEGGGGPGVLEQAKQALTGAAGSVKDTLAGTARSAGDAASSATSAAGERLSEWADTARGWAGSARGSAGDARSAVGGYADSVGGYAGSMGEYAGSAADQARYGYRTSRHAVERGIEDYPLAVGAAAMAIGVLSGLLLPATRPRTVDGPAGRRAEGDGEGAGQTVLETGKQVASAAAGAAADEAGGQEASVGSLAEKVRNVARDVKAAAMESAEREGLDPDSLVHKGRQIADRARDAAGMRPSGRRTRCSDLRRHTGHTHPEWKSSGSAAGSNPRRSRCAPRTALLRSSSRGHFQRRACRVARSTITPRAAAGGAHPRPVSV
jgi:hypothetical protein